MKLGLRHQSTGKAYTFLAVSARLSVRVFFKRIYLWNKKGVPSDRPVLLAANHPTAFMDPYLLCTLLDPPIYNMTRGDLFRKPVFRKMMESINMFPVYRVRDGYSGRDRNGDVFAYCSSKLKERRVIAIYVEGEHHLEKRLRPVQKGVAHIAFQAFGEHHLDDLQVVPAGCNYRYGDRTRDTVMVNIGQPIYVRDYWELFQEQPEAAREKLCAAIGEALTVVCMDIKDPEDDEMTEQLLVLHRSNKPDPVLPIFSYSGEAFLAEQVVVRKVNEMDPSEKLLLRKRLGDYFDALNRADLEDVALACPRHAHWSWLVFFLFTMLPFVLGYLSSLPVMLLADYVTGKKVRKTEFLSSVHLAVGHLAGLVYYPALLLAAILSMQAFWIGLVLSLPLAGWFSIVYMELWSRWRAARRAQAHPHRLALLKQRNRLAADISVPAV
jgi:1-acyl-sn-glycerol-3-phosphate acyltransferase